MALWFVLSPMIVLATGALLLMLAEAFSKRKGGLALGATMVFASGLAFSVAAWWVHDGKPVPGAESVAPWLVLDRFSIFFDGLVCLGGAIASLLPGGYLPQHNLRRRQFHPLLLF